jgi:hypothetical protein
VSTLWELTFVVLQGLPNLHKSFEQYIEKEELKDDNKYRTEVRRAERLSVESPVPHVCNGWSEIWLARSSQGHAVLGIPSRVAAAGRFEIFPVLAGVLVSLVTRSCRS